MDVFYASPAMTNPLPDLLNAKYVKLDVEAREKPEAICEVASLLCDCGCMADYAGFSRELIARDELSSTCMGNGVAFPHARTDCVNEILLAIGRSEKGVAFGNERVHLIFVIGTPRSKIKEYLVIVGALARLLKNGSVRDALLHAKTSAEFVGCLAG